MNGSENLEFQTLLRSRGDILLSEKNILAVNQFRNLILDENQRQNLTKILEPADFIDGHVVDAVELLKSGFVEGPAMDLGSGAGVPGLLCGLIREDVWVLLESEGRKAEFLTRATQELNASHVTVVRGRAEEYLKNHSVKSIVARAVGPVDRIYSWIHGCSTWNNLVLLKGRGWGEEWAAFQATRWRKELKIANKHYYTVGPEKKERWIVRLERAE